MRRFILLNERELLIVEFLFYPYFYYKTLLDILFIYDYATDPNSHWSINRWLRLVLAVLAFKYHIRFLLIFISFMFTRCENKEKVDQFKSSCFVECFWWNWNLFIELWCERIGMLSNWNVKDLESVRIGICKINTCLVGRK